MRRKESICSNTVKTERPLGVHEVDHQCCFDDCPKPSIKEGEQVVQFGSGIWYGGITPAFGELKREWHRLCFKEFSLRWHKQKLPYRCAIGGKKIIFGEHINFYVVGTETNQDNSWSQARGYEIYYVTHAKCPARAEKH